MVHDADPHPGDPGLLWDWRLTRELDAAESAIAFSDSVAARSTGAGQASGCIGCCWAPI